MNIYVTDDEKEIIDQNARTLGMTRSEYLRHVALCFDEECDDSEKLHADFLLLCERIHKLTETQTYAFVHSVIDYLQQGEVNGYGDDQWNNTVKAFATKTDNYPSVPAEYRVFYFYPSSSARQSLMSYEGTPHGYIKIVKASTNKKLTDGNANYSFKDIEYYVSKSKR